MSSDAAEAKVRSEPARMNLYDSLTDSHITRLLREGAHGQVSLYVIAVTAMVVVAAMTAMTAKMMQNVVDVMGFMGGGIRPEVIFVAGGFMLIFFLKGVASYTQAVALTRAGNSIVARQQERLYEKLLRQGAAFFNLNESSDLLMRITQSANAARSVIDTVVTTFVRDLLSLIGLVVVMFYQEPVLSTVSMIIGPLALYGTRLILRKVRWIMEQELASLAEIFKVVQETSAGIMVIKAFSMEEKMASRMERAVVQVRDRANAIAKLQAITSPLMETLSGFAIGGVLFLSAISSFEGYTSTPGNLASFITALLLAYEPAKRLLRMRVSIEANLVGVCMMHELLDLPDTMVEAEEPIDITLESVGVDFHDVTFSYGENGKAILNDLSIHCPSGKTLALVGPSGGGKSTILSLIMRLYDPIGGAVEINGVDLRKVSLKSLRNAVSFVGQNTFLFSTNVIENIRFGRPDATDQEVQEAAIAANAHDFITELSEGYNTNVGENGAFLSGGQKQRLAIARAILKDSPILLLDEATSALDSQSEAQVQDALQKLTRDRTTVVIAHRLSTVLGADKICVIDKGKVAEEGTTEELLAQSGLFRSLYDQQFKAVG